MALRTAAPTTSATPSHGRLGRNITMLAGSQVVTWGLSFLWTVFVPRALGPKGLGQLVVATSFSAILGMVIGLGTSTLMVKEIARDHGRAPSLVGTAMVIRLGLILPAIGVLGLYLQVANFGRQQTLVLCLATASMFLGLLSGGIQSAFQGIERMEYLAYGQVLSEVVVTVLGITLVVLGFGVVTLMALWAAMAAIVLGLNLWWRRGYFNIDWRVDVSLIRFLVINSWPYWITGLVLTVYMWIDSQMLSFMTPITVVGWYGVPTKLFANLLFVAGVLSTAWLPRFVGAFKEGPERLRLVARPAVELVLILSLPISAGVALIAPRLIWVLYGPGFGPAVPVLVVLALSLPPTYLNMIVNQFLIAANRQVAWTKVMVVMTILNPAINLVLIPYFQHRSGNGAIGAALSLLITEVLMAGAALVLMRGVLISTSARKLFRTTLATLGMAVCVWWVRYRFGLALQVLTGMTSFAVLGLALRILTAEERAMLQDVAGRIGRRLGRRRIPA